MNTPAITEDKLAELKLNSVTERINKPSQKVKFIIPTTILGSIDPNIVMELHGFPACAYGSHFDREDKDNGNTIFYCWGSCD